MLGDHYAQEVVIPLQVVGRSRFAIQSPFSHIPHLNGIQCSFGTGSAGTWSTVDEVHPEVGDDQQRISRHLRENMFQEDLGDQVISRTVFTSVGLVTTCQGSTR